MREQDERSESVRHSESAQSDEPTVESETAVPSEHSQQESPSATGDQSGADVERGAAVSGEPGPGEDERESREKVTEPGGDLEQRTPSSEAAEPGEGERAEKDRQTGVTLSESPTAIGAAGESSPEQHAPLFSGEEAELFRERWANVQAGFVDQPRQMVEQADDLVGDLMQQLTAGFSEQRSKLEEHWSEGEDVSTEDLRVTLTRYRSFFNRLLSA
jgi:hypothetical protein